MSPTHNKTTQMDKKARQVRRKCVFFDLRVNCPFNRGVHILLAVQCAATTRPVISVRLKLWTQPLQKKKRDFLNKNVDSSKITRTFLWNSPLTGDLITWKCEQQVLGFLQCIQSKLMNVSCSKWGVISQHESVCFILFGAPGGRS